MTVSLFQLPGVIGIFNCRVSEVSTNCEYKLSRNFINMLEVLLLCYYYLRSAYLSFLTLLYMFIPLQCHGDIEKKSRFKKTIKNPSQSATGILIVYLLIVSQNLLSWKHIFHCISYTYQKLTWMPQYLIVFSK